MLTQQKVKLVEGDRLPKFSQQQAAAGSQGSGGRLKFKYIVQWRWWPQVPLLGVYLAIRLKATLSNQSMN